MRQDRRIRIPKGSWRAMREHAYGNCPQREAEALLQKTQQIFDGFARESAYIGGRANLLRDSFYGGLSVFAYYEACGGQIERPELEALLLRMLMGGISGKGKVLSRINLNNKLLQSVAYFFLRVYARFNNRKVDGGTWGNSWKIAVNPLKRKEGISIHLVGCPVADFAKAHGYENLMPVFCATDFAAAKASGLLLERGHTVAEGWEDCDYWYKNQ